LALDQLYGWRMNSRRSARRTRQEMWGMGHAHSIVESGIMGLTVVDDKLNNFLGKLKISATRFASFNKVYVHCNDG
jgi:hypothetical protein